MSTRGCLTVALLATLLGFGWPDQAWASTSTKDVQIVARMLAFLVTPPTGAAVVGIVYAPGSPDSASEARAFAEQLADGLTIGRITLYARLLPIDQLGNGSGLAAIFIPASLDSQAELPSRLARQLHIPAISNSLACALNGYCALGFITSPTVQIVLNRSVCESAAIQFLPAFRILVKEV